MAIDLPDHTLGFAQTLSTYISNYVARYQDGLTLVTPAGATWNGNMVAVPANRRLVITNASIWADEGVHSHFSRLLVGVDEFIIDYVVGSKNYKFNPGIEVQAGETPRFFFTNPHQEDAVEGTCDIFGYMETLV